MSLETCPRARAQWHVGRNRDLYGTQAQLKTYRKRLLDELEDSAQHALGLVRQLKTLPPGSEAYADADGELYAYTLQLESGARALREAMDALSDALPAVFIFSSVGQERLEEGNLVWFAPAPLSRLAP